MIPDERFAITLKNLLEDAWSGIQLLYADLAFNDALTRDPALLAMANRTPLFWNATVLGWRCGYMLALGRAYDHKTQYNLRALLCLFEDNLEVFSKSALA